MLIDVRRSTLLVAEDLVRIRNISNEGERLNRSGQVKTDAEGTYNLDLNIVNEE